VNIKRYSNQAFSILETLHEQVLAVRSKEEEAYKNLLKALIVVPATLSLLALVLSVTTGFLVILVMVLIVAPLCVVLIIAGAHIAHFYSLMRRVVVPTTV